MKVKIIRVADNQEIDAAIVSSIGFILPSITDGWRFNFKSNTRKEKLDTYMLVCFDTPDVTEGCLSFKMRDNKEAYMAYIELAPHNKEKERLYDKVAGCLIAYACRLSFIYGRGDFQGWLAFDVFEKSEEDEKRLMTHYCKAYGALRFGETTMVIPPDAGERLINTYLKTI